MNNMPEEIPVQIHFWPWSAVNPEGETVDLTGCVEEIPYYGSPVISVSENVSLFLPARHERFVSLGPKYDTVYGTYQLYEVPHGIFTGRNKKQKKDRSSYINIRAVNNNERVLLRANGVRDQDEPLEAIIVAWYQQFDILLKKTKMKFTSWAELEKYFFPEKEREDEPRMALIVKIAEDMIQKMQLIVLAARKILLRERTMVPVARVAEMDTVCLKWIGKQPGDDLIQKAAMHKHRLLGVKRYESFDTLENKILKDFLSRCSKAAFHYLKREVGENLRFQESSRAKKVKGFGQLCQMLFAAPQLAGVAAPPVNFLPNYVLQNDYRYRQVWQHYLRLIRSEEEKDKIWDWQNRTWADLVRIMVCLTFYRLSKPDVETISDTLVTEELFSSKPRLYEEQRTGCWLEPGCEPGPFIIKKAGRPLTEASMLEIVHPSYAENHASTKALGQLGGHLYLVLTSLHTHITTVIVIWAVHIAAALKHPDWDEVGRSAEQALKNQGIMLSRMKLPTLKGIIVASDLAIKESDIQPAEQGGVHIVQVAADPRNWKKAVDGIELILEDAMQEII